MLFQRSAGLACLLQVLSPTLALLTEQQPLIDDGHKNVQAVRAELQKAEIIPTVIDDFLPSLTLSIDWSKKSAKLGNTIKPKKLQHQPTITLHDSTSSIDASMSNMTYIVTLTDPDAPSRDNPKWSEMCHWIATNITINSNSNALFISGPDDVMTYKPPGPPPKTGKHRYVFLVFAPKNGTTEVLHLSKPKDRKHWGTGEKEGGVRNWAEVNGLVPVAANFLYAKNKKQ